MLDVERLGPVKLRAFTRAEFDRLVAEGWFEGERVELLRGGLVEVSPQGDAHAEILSRLNEWALPPLLGRARVRVQLPLGAAGDSEPEPDLAVAAPGDYLDGHPTTALLVIEVAVSSLRLDRGVKRELYAEAGVPDYWIVNLAERQVEVYREPEGSAYRSRVVVRPGESLAPLAFPDVRLDVGELLRGV